MGRKTRQLNTLYIKEWRRRATSTLVECMGKKCRVCGYNKCLRSLCFHHYDPQTKHLGISELISRRGWASLIKEAQKCVLVCLNCHGEIEAGIIKSPELLDYNFPEKLDKLNIKYYKDLDSSPSSEGSGL